MKWPYLASSSAVLSSAAAGPSSAAAGGALAAAVMADQWARLTGTAATSAGVTGSSCVSSALGGSDTSHRGGSAIRPMALRTSDGMCLRGFKVTISLNVVRRKDD